MFGGEFLAGESSADIRFLTPLQVQRVSQVTSRISGAELRERFNPEEMTALGIYPSSDLVQDFWFRPNVLDWFIEKYGELSSFYTVAAECSDFVVQWRSA